MKPKLSLPDGLEMYSDARIFSDEHAVDFVPGEVHGPVAVGGNKSLLSKEYLELRTFRVEFRSYIFHE